MFEQTRYTRLLAVFLMAVGAAGIDLQAQPIVDAEGDVGIGSLTTEPTAVLELVATNKGFLVPRMSQIQRDAIAAPADALMIFNTTTSEFNFWDPSTASWEVFITSSNVMDYAWVLEGNNLNVAVDPTLQSAYNGATGAFLGTTSADDAVIATVQPQDIEFWTAATQRAILDATGNFYPATDNSYTLGTDAMRWADAYVNGGSVHIGPSGGEAGNTEMNLGYAAGTGSIDVDGGADEITITTATTTVTNNLDANAGVDVTGADLTVGGTNFVVDVATGAIDAPNGGHDFGTSGVDAQVVLIEGLPFTAPNYELIVDGDVQITGLLALPALTPNSVLYTDAGGNVSTDNPPFSYVEGTNTMTTENVVVTTLGDFQGTVENSTGNLTLDDATDVTGILDAQATIVNTTPLTSVTVDDDLLVNNTTTLVEEFDAQDFGNEIGDGTDQQQLVIDGNDGAIIGNTLAANPPEWDLVVRGDQVTTGLIKAGGSIWIDGFTPGNHQIVSNDELNVGSLTASDVTLSTNATTAVTIDGATQNVDITNSANVGGMLNVVDATTLQSTLDVDGITDLNSNLNVFGPTDLNSTLNVDGGVTINNTINQTGGGQVSFSGNVDATSGLDVSGQDLTVGGANFNVEVTTGTVTSLGAGNSFGNGGGVQQVIVDGTADALVGQTLAGNPNVWDLVVLGDQVTTGVTKFGGSIWIDGSTPGNHSIVSNDDLRIEVTGAGNQLQIVSEGGISYETDGNYRFTGDQATAGGGLNPVPTPEDHVVIIENTNTGDGNGNGLAIVIEDNVSAFSNNYISFYHGETTTEMSGRIEGFSRQDFLDLSAEIASVVSNPGNYNPFNYIDFDFPITYNPNFISFSGGSLPSLSGGSLPSLDIDFNFTDGLDFDFSPGSLPTLNVGSLPTISFSAPFTFGTPTFGFDFTGGGTLTGELLGTTNPGLAWSMYGDPVGSALLFVDFTDPNYKGGVTYESGSGDYAEWLERADHAEDIRIGEVVGVRGGKISKQTEGTDQLMVISWKPAVLGNMPDKGSEKNYEKVAFMGQIPVKVRGRVNVGDYLVASGLEDGTARAVAPESMTAELAEKVVGVAWTSAEESGINLVKAAVGLKPHEYMQVIRNQEEKIEDLERRLLEIERRLATP